MSNGTTPIPFDNSGAVNFNPTASPIPQIQGTYGNLEKGFSNAINAQPTVPQLTAKYNDQFGVPQLQNEAANDQATQDKLNTQIANAGKTIGQASQESIMTQGQKDAAVTSYTQPLQQQLGVATTDLSRTNANLGTAQKNASDMVTAEQAQQVKQLQPWTQAFKDADVTTAMQMTGWTQENAQQLQVLLANQSTGKELTLNEQNNLEKLAEQEQNFENALKLQQDKEANAITPITANDVGIYQGGANGSFTTGSSWS